MVRKKATTTQEEINVLLESKMKEYEKRHTAWIVLKHGYTYIGYDIYDNLTQILMASLVKLMELMNTKYSIKHPFFEDKEYYLIVDGKDKTRAEFIQKFIDNGYKLSW